MTKGIIYVMTTVVPGLVKIGMVRTEEYESVMRSLERNGYFNVVGLRQRYAIEVEDCEEKKGLLDAIFSKSRVSDSDLFALSDELVTQLLSSFAGEQVFPKKALEASSLEEPVSKEPLSEEPRAKEAAVPEKRGGNTVPDGEYYLLQRLKGGGDVFAKMRVENGTFTVLRGSKCSPVRTGVVPKVLQDAPIKDDILQADICVTSPSTAAWIVVGHSINGWVAWMDKNGNPLDTFRK